MDRRLVHLALVPVVLACAACGTTDDAERGPASQPPRREQGALTRAQFVAKANAICAHASERPPGGQDASTHDQLEMAMDVWSGVVRELRDLDPPPGDRARVDRMLTHFETAIRAGREAAAADDESALAAFAGVFDQGSKGAAIAHSYGLDVCSPVPVMPSAEDLSENEAFRKAMLDLIRQVEAGDAPALTEP